MSDYYDESMPSYGLPGGDLGDWGAETGIPTNSERIYGGSREVTQAPLFSAAWFNQNKTIVWVVAATVVGIALLKGGGRR